MKRIVFFLFCFGVVAAFAQRDSAIYIPKDLNDCHRVLNSMLDDSTKALIMSMTEKEFTAGAHLGLGMWMRNNWGLWGGSRLQTYMTGKGLRHPDDMSGLILTTYWRRMHHEPLRVRKEVRKYQVYWKEYGYEPKLDPARHKGYNEAPIDSNVAFLNLPVADSVTGAVVYLPKLGDTIDGQTLAYVARHAVASPRRFVHPNEEFCCPLSGPVSRVLTIIYNRGKHYCSNVVWWTDFCDVGQGRMPQHVENVCLGEYGSLLWNIRVDFRYHDGMLEEMDIDARNALGEREWSLINSFLGRHQFRVAQEGIVEYYYHPEYDSEPTDSLCYVVDSAGRVLLSYDDWYERTYYQYDAQGRIVSERSFHNYSDEQRKCVLANYGMHVYDDENRLRYAFGDGDSDVILAYYDEHGNIVGGNYKDLRNGKRSHVFRFHYDRYGNWTRITLKGRLVAKRKIEYDL